MCSAYRPRHAKEPWRHARAQSIYEDNVAADKSFVANDNIHQTSGEILDDYASEMDTFSNDENACLHGLQLGLLSPLDGGLYPQGVLELAVNVTACEKQAPDGDNDTRSNT